ncbi:MAG: HutD family protein [Clostridiales bacterium]|nr:HutD family protein [Clostridiales bacterium]
MSLIAIIPASEQRTTNWSGGTTTELFIWPKTASYKERRFDFRISTAVVEDEESVFTRLEGVKRFLTPLCDGFDLTVNGRNVSLKRGGVLEFSGEDEVACRGRGRDLNLMLKNADGEMRIVRGGFTVPECTFAFAFADEPCRLSSGEIKKDLPARAFAMLEKGGYFAEGELVLFTINVKKSKNIQKGDFSIDRVAEILYNKRDKKPEQEARPMGRTIITISRQFGSGGRTIAKAVAEKLGYAYYDREIIEKVSEMTGFAPEYIEENGEYAPGKTIFSLAGSFLGSSRAMGGMSAYDYLWVMQRNAILEVADEGPCVIVGRCSDYILKDREDALHVFIHAPMDARAKRIVEKYGESDKRPEERLKEKDSKRSVNYKHFTGRVWGDCRNYDICLNSDVVGIEKCVDIIADLAKSADHRTKFEEGEREKYVGLDMDQA